MGKMSPLGASTTASGSSLSAEVYNDVLLQKQDEIFSLGEDITLAVSEGRYKRAASLRSESGWSAVFREC